MRWPFARIVFMAAVMGPCVEPQATIRTSPEGSPSATDVRNILRDALYFFGARANHVLVIQWFVVDVAGDVLLFDAADAMFEAWSAGNGPGARESVRIALVWLKAFGICFKVHGDLPGDRRPWELSTARRRSRDSRPRE